MESRRIAAVLAAAALLAAACGDDDGGLETTSPETTAVVTTTTTTVPAAATTTTAPATTTTAPTTSTTAATTTTTTAPPFEGDTDPKQGDTAGSPSPNLVDVRTGAHPGFTRVVWEMDGDAGTPMYMVGYADPPFVDIGGFEVPVDGSAFLRVIFFPGMRFDISGPEAVQTYFGPETLDVDSGSVVQVAFVEDFEANMEWVIGLTGEKPFAVFTLENPTRLVVDVAD